MSFFIRKNLLFIFLLLGFLLSSFTFIASSAFLYLNPQIPDSSSLTNIPLTVPFRIYSSDNKLIQTYGARRIPLNRDQIPELLIKALLDTEDKRFYSHIGVDFISLLDDTFKLLLTAKVTSGASTITMQLARNLWLSREKTFIRKFKEILLAIKIEHALTKDQILTAYMNVVFLGNRSYGMEAAAQTYYNKSLNELTLSQLAMLAGIPQAPSRNNPISNPQAAKDRRQTVLLSMLNQGSITLSDYKRANAAPVTAKLYFQAPELDAPYVAEFVRKEMFNLFGKDLYTKGYVAVTTIDSKLQKTSNTALIKGLFAYDKRHGFRPPSYRASTDSTSKDALLDWSVKLSKFRVYHDTLFPALVTHAHGDTIYALQPNNKIITIHKNNFKWARPYIDVDTKGSTPKNAQDILQVGDLIYTEKVNGAWTLTQIPNVQGAIVSLNSHTGAILSVTGGFDYTANQFNHATQLSRQPGSGFKPFIYSAAIEQGITPSDLFLDAPLTFNDKSLETTYRPQNSNKKYRGATRLRSAFYRSINLVSMRILQTIGIQKTLSHIQNFNIDTKNFPENLQLAIGGGTIGMSPLQMAASYATFSNNGKLITPHIIQEIRDIHGDVIDTHLTPHYMKKCMHLDECPDQPLNQKLSHIDLPTDQAIDPRNAYIMQSLLKDVIKKGTGRRARVLNRSDIGGKTGTTNEADVWFNGFGADITSTVWLGFSDNRPLGANEYGSNAALPIWIDFMKVALSDKKEEKTIQPSGINIIRVDKTTGKQSFSAQNTMFEYFYSEYPPAKSESTPVTRDKTVLPEEIW